MLSSFAFFERMEINAWSLFACMPISLISNSKDNKQISILRADVYLFLD